MRLGQAEAHGEDVVDGTAEIAGAELLIALEQQSGAEEEHNGERDLRGEKSLAQARAAADAAVRTRGALQGLHELARVQAEPRDEAGRDPCGCGDCSRKDERPCSEVNFLHAGDVEL